jgi:hypothetical protein
MEIIMTFTNDKITDVLSMTTSDDSVRGVAIKRTAKFPKQMKEDFLYIPV